MHYNKLIRDKIPEIIAKKGGTAVTHSASPDEYRAKLTEKLQEEVLEFKESETVEETADIFEVIDALIELHGFNRAEIIRVQAEKAEERGKFKERIILDES